jgi:hypothetical protein
MKKKQNCKFKYFSRKLSLLKSHKTIYLIIFLISYACNHSQFTPYELNCDYSKTIGKNKNLTKKNLCHSEKWPEYEIVDTIIHDNNTLFTINDKAPSLENQNHRKGKGKNDPETSFLNYRVANTSTQILYNYKLPSENSTEEETLDSDLDANIDNYTNESTTDTEERSIDTDREASYDDDYNNDLSNPQDSLEEETDHDNINTYIDQPTTFNMPSNEPESSTAPNYINQQDEEFASYSNANDNQEEYDIINQNRFSDIESIFMQDNEDDLGEEAVSISELIEAINESNQSLGIEEPIETYHPTTSLSNETNGPQARESALSDEPTPPIEMNEEPCISEAENCLPADITIETTEEVPSSTRSNRPISTEDTSIPQIPIDLSQQTNTTGGGDTTINTFNLQEEEIINSMSSITDRNSVTNAIIKYPSRRTAIISSVELRSTIYKQIAYSKISMTSIRRNSSPITNTYLTMEERNARQSHQNDIDKAQDLADKFTRLINLLTSKGSIGKEGLLKIERLKHIPKGELLIEINKITKNLITK